MIEIALALILSAATPADARRQTLGEEFCRVQLRYGGEALLEGELRREMAPLLTTRFLRVLDQAWACQEDWMRQQPTNSTDKPPFVDCCLFSSSNDYFPTSCKVGASETLPDGRTRVELEYAYSSGTENARWHVALVLVEDGKRLLIDDFLGGVGEAPSTEPWELSKAFTPCRDGRWIGYQQEPND